MESLDERVGLMQEVVRAVRSLKQDYLPPKARPEGGYLPTQCMYYHPSTLHSVLGVQVLGHQGGSQ